MITGACLALFALTAQTPSRAVVLPVRVVQGAAAELKTTAQLVEGTLAEALGRHADFHVMSRAEIAAMMDKATQQQLMGCDAESCLTELADALGAELLVASRLDVEHGFWNLQSSLLERVGARVIRRAAIKARGVDNLLSSVDQLARQLASGSRVSMDDPELPRRLGTDAQGLSALQARHHERPDEDLVSSWTATVVEKNRESGRLAFLEGALVLASGGTALMGAALTALSAAYFFTLSQSLTKDGLSEFPWLAALVLVMTPLPALVGVGAMQLILLATAILDARDVGRVKVGRLGCCRDEEVIQDAEAPTPAQRAAPHLAAFGALFSFFAPCAFCGVQGCCLAPTTYGLVEFHKDALDPTLPMGAQSILLLAGLVTLLNTSLLLVLALPTGVSALVAALLLMGHQDSQLTDDAAPARASAASP